MIDLFVILILALMFVMACGEDSYETVEEPSQPVPTEPVEPTKPGAPTEPEDDAFALAVSAVQANCVSCHNGVVQAPSLKGEDAVTKNKGRICIRVGTRSMPPGGGLPVDEQTKILKGLEC